MPAKRGRKKKPTRTEQRRSEYHHGQALHLDAMSAVAAARDPIGSFLYANLSGESHRRRFGGVRRS